MIDAAYDDRSYDLVRFRDDPFDDVISGLIDATIGVSAEEVARQRSVLQVSEMYTLMSFAHRQSVRALRERDQRMAASALRALTLVDRQRVDYRDVSVQFPLYALVSCGGSADAALDEALARCGRDMVQVFELARGRATQLSVADCGLLPVQSHYGLGFMSLDNRHRVPGPRLIESAIAFADGVDSEGTYRPEQPRATHLPAVWFDPARGADKIPTPACITISCRRVGYGAWSHSLLAFLAEVRDRRTATHLAKAAHARSTSDRPRTARATGSTLLLLVGGSVTAGEEALETPQTLTRFSALLP